MHVKIKNLAPIVGLIVVISACDSSSKVSDGGAAVDGTSSSAALIGAAIPTEITTVEFSNWDAAETYDSGSVVSRNDQMFVSTSTTSSDPMLNPEDWDVVQDSENSLAFSDALYWRGEWDLNSTYAEGAIVIYQGQSYVALQSIEAGTLPEDADYWAMFARHGEDGQDGAAGSDGAQGQIGLTGPKGDTGDTGLTGPKGDTGDTGLTGIQGDQGETGPKGDTGLKGDTGDTGATGESGPAGTPGLVWSGEWSSIGSYDTGDAVTHTGSSFIAIQDVPANTLPTNTSYWDVLAAAGSDGDDGGDAGGSGGSSSTFVVAGRTSTIHAGNAGYRAINAACKADYGDTARMATSADIANSPLSGSVTGMVWIQGIAHPSSISIDNTSGMNLSSSASNLTCNSWSSTSGMGLAVFGNSLSMNEYASCANSLGAMCSVESSTSATYEFKGFSTSTVSGSAGYLGMANACQTDYGDDARMANTQEIAQSSLDTTQAGSAWVQGIAHGSDPGIDSITGTTVGAGGSLTCKGWSNSGSIFGLVVDGSTYSVGTQYCYTQSAVACSAP